jgi:apolipoprotein N-acyltransferase
VWVGVAAILLITPIAIAPFSWGASDKALADQPSSSVGSAEASTIEVAMIQGNVPEIGMDFNARRLAILQNHLRLTETLLAEASTEIQDGVQQARRKLDLVIWPENSSDIDPLADPVVYSEISQVTDRLNVPILVGAVIQDPANQEQVLNAGILWQPKVGPTQKYIKQHPVLFGEFVPFRPLLTRLIGRFDKVPRDFGKGDTPGVFNIGGKPVGDVICFEVADDAVVRDTVRSGAEVLIVQTNNATYNLLGQTEQQLQIGRVRAKEFDRFVLVSATSGISAIVDNHGKVVQEVGEFEAAIMRDTVPLISTQTWSAKFGHSISLLIFALGVTSAFIGFFFNFQNRR